MRSKGLFAIYNAMVLFTAPLIALYILARWRQRVLRKGFLHWSERWGTLSAPQQAALAQSKRWWWVHVASLGEVKAILPFLKKAREVRGIKVLLSAVTPEAIAWAQENKVADLVLAAPIDLPWIVRRFLTAIRPELVVSVESEFWPNLIRQAHLAGATVALINGRISARSYRAYQRIRFILAAIWECIDVFAMREQADADRILFLGASPDRVTVTGNVKYDIQVSAERPQRLSSPLVLILASTREGEEEALLPTVQNLLAKNSSLRVIWAPRHIERVSEVEALLRQHGLTPTRKSTRENAVHVIWDSLGDLQAAYQQADIAVVGGSFVPKGGQNPIEAAALQLPVVFGPSMENFADVAQALVRRGGGFQVSLEALETQLRELISNPTLRHSVGGKAGETVYAAQGATDRVISLLQKSLPQRVNG